ncbi:hypothetical protein [Zunongwangia sp. H14]|uniref:hypothetical protein n=1 Tax=Zunongwangia sp. H14 TaxID=3240792 RepID=UPI00356699AE
MKKKIEQELYHLAEKILKNKSNNDIASLKNEVLKIYEKLTLLAFTEKFMEEAEAQPQMKKEKEEPKEDLQQEQRKREADKERASYFAPDGTEYSDSESITEPATEKIKNIVSQMPPEADQFHNLFESTPAEEQVPGGAAHPPKPREPGPHQVPSPSQNPAQDQTPPQEKSPSQPHTSQPQLRRDSPQPHSDESNKPGDRKKRQGDFHDFGVDYDSLPEFEPVNQNGKVQRPRSLNDRLKKGINIGLNERLSFIKHLFEGNTADYNRVISQLNTFDSLEEAHKFIQLVVKPDYNNWEGKEEQEHRFWEKIENKFN